MQVHAGMIIAGYTAKEGHTILGGSIAGSHDLATTTRGRCPVYRANRTRCIFTTVIRDIKPYDGRPTTRWRPLHEQDLSDLPVLAKVFVGPQGRNELEHRMIGQKQTDVE